MRSLIVVAALLFACRPPAARPTCATQKALCLAEARTALAARPPDPPAAAILLEIGCNRGDDDACVLWADLLAANVVKSTTAAPEPLLRGACDRGHGMACVQLANERAENEATAEELITILDKACRAGEPLGCLGKARVLVAVAGSITPEAETIGADARAQLEQGCADGVAERCTAVGKVYANGLVVAPDLHHAVTALARACELGDGNGCALLGVGQVAGQGTEKSVEKARASFTRACDLAAGRGCSLLGVLALEAKDTAGAMALFERGCDLRDGFGCLQLGAARGARSSVEAAPLYARACDLDFTPACNRLGLMTQAGDGVTRDDARARELFRLACATPGDCIGSECQAEDADACNNLGFFLVQGRGGAVNIDAGVSAFLSACAYGHQGGCANARLVLGPACDTGNAKACELLARLPPPASQPAP
jgi:TPR repeat protein